MSVSDWLQIAIGVYFFVRRGVVFVISHLPQCPAKPVAAALAAEIAEGAD
jgi:hypothetical protein